MREWNRWQQSDDVTFLWMAAQRRLITHESRNIAQTRCYPTCDLCHLRPSYCVDARGWYCLACYVIDELSGRVPGPNPLRPFHDMESRHD